MVSLAEGSNNGMQFPAGIHMTVIETGSEHGFPRQQKQESNRASIIEESASAPW